MAMTKSAQIEALLRVGLFSELSKRQLGHVAKVTYQSTYAAGDVVIKEQDTGHKLVLIVRGQAKVVRGGRRIASAGPGDAVGEIALIDGMPRSASVVAETPLETLLIFRTEFRKLLDEIPGLWEKLLLAQTARLRAANRELAARG